MIYLVRHGLDDEKYIGGWSNVSLVPEGVDQINKTAKSLLSMNIKLEKIYTSDLPRAVQSAEILQNYFGINYEATSTLRELNKGDFNGILKIHMPEEWQNINCAYQKYPNGESLVTFEKRIRGELIPKLEEFNNCLLVTHRGVINMLYSIYNDSIRFFDKEKCDVNHASVHELDLKKESIIKLSRTIK